MELSIIKNREGELELRLKQKRRTVREALEASIEKWEWVVAVERANADIFSGAARTCALCQLFIKKGCNGCPVSAHTGHPYCKGTPLIDFDDAHTQKSRIVVAQQEVEFLKLLRKWVKR